MLDMRLKLALAGLMVSSLVATPVMASSATALSVAKASNVKAVSAPKKANKMSSEAAIGGTILAIGALVIAVTDDDKSDSK